MGSFRWLVGAAVLVAVVCAALVFAMPAVAGITVETHQGAGAEGGLPERADIALDELNQKTAKRQTTASDDVIDAPKAEPSQAGCSTQLLSTNFSSRNGSRPAMLVLHYTVSTNVEGWGDVNAIFGWFSQDRAQASSHYIIDFEGNCRLIVPESAKAWTQGNFNPWSISIEFIARGSESRDAWKSSRGLRVGAKVFADAAERWGIPIRLVDPEGCVVQAGITDHNALECLNVHTDVRPNFPYQTFLDLVRAADDPQYRYQLRDNGEVKATSRTFRADNAAARLEEFTAQTRDLMLRRFRYSDSRFNLVRVRVG